MSGYFMSLKLRSTIRANWAHVVILTILVTAPSLVTAQSISEKAFIGDHVLELTAWDFSDGLPGSYISNFFQSSKGILFLHLPKFGTFTFDGVKTKPLPPGQKVGVEGFTPMTYFAEDVNGNIWTITKKNGNNPIADITISDGYGHRSMSFASYVGLPKDSLSFFREPSRIKIDGHDIYFRAQKSLELWKYDGELRLKLDLDLEPLGTICDIFPSLVKDRYFLLNTAKKEVSLINGEGEVLGRLDSVYQKRINWDKETYRFHEGNLFFNCHLETIEALVLKGDSVLLEEIPSSVPRIDNSIPIIDGGSGYQILTHGQSQNHHLYLNGKVVLAEFDKLIKEEFGLELNSLVRKFGQNTFWFRSNPYLVRLRLHQSKFENIELSSSPTSVRSISPVGVNQLLVSTYKGNYLLPLTLDGSGEATTTLDSDRCIRATLEMNGAYWIGTENRRLSLLNGENGQQLKLVHTFRSPGNIAAIAPQKNGELLLGTSTGLMKFDPNTGQENTVEFVNQPVHTIYTSHNQTTWVGCQDGLLNLTTKETFLTGFQVRHIYEDSGVFWIATNKGLIEWTIGSKNHQLYSTEHGLANTIIHCVYPDNNDNLWMSTDYGLVKFSKAPPHKVQVFFKEDGLPGNEFNQFAHYRNEKGELYLGGTKGLVRFNPDSIHWEGAATHFPTTLEEVLVYDNKNRLRFKKQLAELSSLETLQLPTSSHRVELKFTSPYYGAAELVKEWRTSRLYPEWTKVTENEINFHFLDYGADELEIRTYPFGNTSKIETFKIKLDKPIPFHKATFFFFLLAVSLVIGTYFLAKESGRYEKEKLEKLVRQKTLSIEQQKEELEKVSSYREKFFKNITHDFKTPLSIILGSSEQIAKQKKVSSNTLTQVERISNNALQLNRLTDQIFELTKADNKQLQLDESTIEWGRFCKGIVESLTLLAEEKSINYTIKELPHQLTYLQLDLQKMEQVLRNLLSNAIKFTPPSGSVSFSTTVQEDTIEFQVEDSGPGIPANEVEHVFKRYFQGVITDKLHFTGLGIGLSLCKDYLELMNGTIEVSTSSVGGACFRVAFPKKTSEESLVEELTPTIKPMMPGKEMERTIVFNHGKPVLLIVEDNIDLLSYYRESLINNYALLLAKNGQDALALLNKSHLKVDLIISDVMMPEMNGYEFLEIIKKSQQYASIPFILVTALNDPIYKLNALRTGIDAYLSKPFSIEELCIRVDNLLRYQQLRSTQKSSSSSEANKETAEIKQELIKQLTPYENEWLAQLEKAVSNRMSDPDLRINMLASDLGVSKRTLHTKIRTYTGLAPNEYLVKARLAEALKFLQENRYKSIAETCYQVGFKHPSHFAKLFKKEYGRLPSSYM